MLQSTDASAGGGAFVREYHGETLVHPVGLAVLIVLGLTTFLVPRRWSAFPMIALVCFVPPAQRVTVLDLDFDFLRIMVLCCWSRLALRRELRPLRWTVMDGLLVAFCIYGTIAYTLQRGEIGALIYQAGASFDALGLYFFFRIVIQGPAELEKLVQAFIVVAVPVAVAFLIESRTARNVFAVFGGVREVTRLRQGRLRCQGAFAHPIMAGCFWASMMPLMAAFWWRARGGPLWALVGLSSAAVVVVTCSSSTPLVAVFFGAVGAMAYLGRRWMPLFRWGLLATLVSLHLAMKAPVWHLLSRMDAVGGSTGYHRFMLVDQSIRRIDEWFLVGTSSTAHWGHQAFDLTNQYVGEAVQGGLGRLALFLALLVAAYRAVGEVCRRYSASPRLQLMVWLLGTALFVHTMNFWAVSYFGQIKLVWYFHLAAVASLWTCPERIDLPGRAGGS